MLLLWIHWLAAMALIGGMAFYYLVLGPMRSGTGGSDAPVLMGMIDRRFRSIRWISLAALLGTGIANLIREGDSPRMVSGYGGLLLLKLLLVLVLAGLMGIHDFGGGGQSEGKAVSGPLAGVIGRWVGYSTFLMGIVIVLLTVYLVRM